MAIGEKSIKYQQKIQIAQQVASILAQGPDAFMIYVDLHWDKSISPKVVFATRLVLDAMEHAVITDSVDIYKLIHISETIGKLALKHHLLTIKGSIKIAHSLSRIMMHYISAITNKSAIPVQPFDTWLRCTHEISLTIAKLLARAKFSKDYALSRKNTIERQQIEVLREI